MGCFRVATLSARSASLAGAGHLMYDLPSVLLGMALAIPVYVVAAQLTAPFRAWRRGRL
jgi:hypothetical protein